MRNILPLLALALVTSCSPKVSTQLLENNSVSTHNAIQAVDIIDIDQSVPPDAKKLGSVRVFDAGLTLKCDWKTVLEKAKLEAINAGGNILKITKHTPPGIMSSCHQINADIYYVDTTIERKIASTEIQVDSLSGQKNESVKAPLIIPFQKYRLSFNGGLSFLLAKTSDDVPADFKQYVKELKSGSHFSIDGGYFWKENIGLGLKYSSFFSKNSINDVTFEDINGQSRYGRMEDNINTQFIGAMLYNRGYSKSRNTIWFLNASLGYIAYKNNAKLVDDFMITGSTVGFGLDLGVDFKLTQNLYLGLGANYTAGALRKLTYNNGFSEQTVEMEEGSYESMNRLDLLTGLRWTW